MEIKSLSDLNLVVEAKKIVAEELRFTLEVLKYLREIDRRKLFSDYKYSSLKEFAMRELGYSSDEAESRITAMKIIKDVPVVETKVTSGELSLTHLKLAQNFFNNEKRKGDGEYSKADKLEFLENLSNTSTREAQKIMFKESTAPETLVADRIKEISAETLEFKFQGSQKLRNLIDHTKGLLAHKMPGAGLNEILEFALEKLVAELEISKTKTKTEIKASENAKSANIIETTKPVAERSDQESEVESLQRGAVPKKVARAVFSMAKSKCENCESVFALQIEHIHPRALGGTHELDNLKLLCRNCNLRQAVKVYGAEKMQAHFTL